MPALQIQMNTSKHRSCKVNYWTWGQVEKPLSRLCSQLSPINLTTTAEHSPLVFPTHSIGNISIGYESHAMLPAIHRQRGRAGNRWWEPSLGKYLFPRWVSQALCIKHKFMRATFPCNSVGPERKRQGGLSGRSFVSMEIWKAFQSSSAPGKAVRNEDGEKPAVRTGVRDN